MKDAKNDYHTIRIAGEEWFPYNWIKRLDGYTITSSVWTVPSGLTKTDETMEATATQAKLLAVIEGEYCVINKIVTSNGEKFTGKFTVNVVSECEDC